MSSSSARNSDQSDEGSGVMADWALVSKDGELQDVSMVHTSGDDSSSISGSSIEVMSLEDDETDLDLGEPSSHTDQHQDF
ncbi:hypothetical protein KUTeg_018138 [Tegillarca granosa]|uniref:Uncharacterized protein n=1 Tax=Tegillarca granosa TaxID=220873 RepID=A0ABQ9ELX2_TEGGR|nr:hypothetical protein KUTeg_018138 [Tegillarca granosa]